MIVGPKILEFNGYTIDRIRATFAVDILGYDRYVIAFSGGKDSINIFLWLLEQGVPIEKIELRHHLIDGFDDLLFDWACSTAYCRQFAASFGVRFLTSAKVGGFRRELLRQDSLTAPMRFEMLDGSFREAGGKTGDPDTRRRFPQVSADLTVRWCSAYLKIDVMAAICRNDERFRDSRTLILTGERAEESAARSNYAEYETDRADLRHGKHRRIIDHLRPGLRHTEHEVWDRLQRWGVCPHVAYYLGFGRLSCLFCIFGNQHQFASARFVAPDRFNQLADYEDEFSYTVKRRVSLRDLAARGTPYPQLDTSHMLNWTWIQQARSKDYFLPVRCAPEEWMLPAGAYRTDSCGPS